MAIDFPNSPSNGDIHTVSGKRWQWDGEKWQAYGASLAPDVLYVDQGNARVGINDTTPSYSLDVTGTAHVTGAITASGGVAGALTGNADTATALATARTIGGVSFDGTANIAVTLAATATALATARTIGGVSFDGTGNINLPGVNAAGNQNTSGTAATVTTAAQSAITSLGTLTSLSVSSGTDISPDSNGAGQFKVSGNGYAGFIAKDATAMHFGHNSSSRGLYLMTDETTRLAITGAGNVGIGTTAPAHPLHVGSNNRAVCISDAGGTNYAQISATSADGTGHAYLNLTSYSTFFKADGNHVMAIRQDGNVGIGTTSPGEALHVVTASSAAYLKQYNGTATTYLGPDSSNTGLFGTSSAHDVRFITTNTERMRILAAGNVGIGTASPTQSLEVNGLIVAGNTTDAVDMGLVSGLATIRGINAGLSAYNDLSIRVTSGTQLYLDTSGYVGINTAAPNAKLTVKGAAYNQTLNIQSGSVGLSYGIQFQDSGGTNYGFVGSPANDDLHLWAQGASSYMYFQAGGTYRVYMHNGGDWLPYVDDTYDLGGGSKHWDDIYATNNVIQTSDVSLKSDVVDTPLGLGFIQALRPIQYRWNSGVRNHQGFIAQEVETVLDATSGVTASQTALWGNAAALSDTEFLPVEGEDGIPRPVEVPIEPLQSLRYTEFIAPLVKAVQELATRVAALESA